MPLIDSYTSPSGHGIELHHQEAGDRWHVMCWNPPEEDGQLEELHWDIDYVVLSQTATGRQTTRPMTEEDARKEFERWRK